MAAEEACGTPPWGPCHHKGLGERTVNGGYMAAMIMAEAAEGAAAGRGEDGGKGGLVYGRVDTLSGGDCGANPAALHTLWVVEGEKWGRGCIHDACVVASHFCSAQRNITTDSGPMTDTGLTSPRSLCYAWCLFSSFPKSRSHGGGECKNKS